MAKYNQLLRIEEELGIQPIFLVKKAFKIKIFSTIIFKEPFDLFGWLLLI
jgi:hypothetical protein